jgi:hypothetical protein
MADMDCTPEIEMLDHGGCIGSVVVHVVAGAHLRGAAESAAVMRDDAIAVRHSTPFSPKQPAGSD